MVTNMVADVRGFSELSRKHHSSSVYALVKEIFTTFNEIINTSKGTLKDYAGDAIFAFWNHQFEPDREQAVLACKTAIRQANVIREIHAKLSDRISSDDTLTMGWGITTGRVTMAHYGSRPADLALVGDCINLAFRFSGVANKELPAEIVICSQTAELVSSSVSVEDLGEISVRGRKGAERIFTVR